MSSESFIEITDSCIVCGRCVAICPRYIFEIDKEKNTAITNTKISRCHNCGHCVAICPQSAIINHRMGENLEIAFPKIEDSFNYEDTLRLIRKRRSIRRFKKTLITSKQFQQLIELAKYAPTGHNTRKVSYTIVPDRNRVEIIYKHLISFFQSTIKNLHNPLWVSLAFVIGKGTSVKKGRKNEYRLRSHISNYKNGKDTIFHHAPSLLLIHEDSTLATPQEDCVLAAYNIMLGAPTIGLGATYIGYLTNAWKYSKKIKKLIDLPSNHKLYSCLAIGEPKFDFKRLVPRPKPEVQIWKKK